VALVSDEDREFLKKHFEEGLADPVKLVFFTQRESPLFIPGAHAQECAYCRETRQLLEEVASLSDKLEVESHDFVSEKDLADAYGIDKIPATIVSARGEQNVRFFGIPSGYEFATLIQAIVDVSQRSSNLSPRAKNVLSKLDEDVHLQVLVTPT
jgi:glutaredoxin-like protein